MNIQYLNPFIQGFCEILAEFGVIVEKRGQLSIASNLIKSDGFAVLIGINGQIKGNVIYDMSRQTALDLASKMYGTEMKEITEEVTDSISELGNMVSGKASGTLHSELDIFFNITPPNIVFGEQTIVTNSTIDFIVIPLDTNCGRVKINLAIKE